MELKFLELSYDDGGGAVPYTREQARAIWAVQVGVGDDSSFLGTHPSIVSTTLRLPLAHFGGGGGVVYTGARLSIPGHNGVGELSYFLIHECFNNETLTRFNNMKIAEIFCENASG